MLASGRHTWSSGTERTEERSAAGAAPAGQWNSDLDCPLHWRQSFAEFEGEAGGRNLERIKTVWGHREDGRVTHREPREGPQRSGVPD